MISFWDTHFARRLRAFLLAGIWLAIGLPARADVIVSFNNAIAALSNLNPAPASVDADIVAGGIQGQVTLARGAGLTTGAATTGRFNSSSVSTASLALALSGSEYLTWTVTPQAGSTINFDSVAFTLQSSGSGAPNYALFSSLASFSSGNELQTGSIPTNSTATPFTFNFGPSFDAVTTPVEFRLYLWGGSGSGTTSINALQMLGSVPEPSGGLLLAVGGGAIAGFCRRRR